MNKGALVCFRDDASHVLAPFAKGMVGEIIEVTPLGEGLASVSIQFPEEFDVSYDHVAKGVMSTQLLAVEDTSSDTPEDLAAMFVSAFRDGNFKKRGARHGKIDQEHLNSAHDHLAKMVENKHCVSGDAEQQQKPAGQEDEARMGPMGSNAGQKAAEGDDLTKAGARHSKATLDCLKTAHDALVKVGAACPGTMHKD